MSRIAEASWHRALLCLLVGLGRPPTRVEQRYEPEVFGGTAAEVVTFAPR